ncbi:acetyl-CoA acetyltransferase [Afipia sp. P52-10]|uniref:CaiB/BaiF CoA transferase family protein n=1 Tax=Afipia sp. P52-10 TaxID=1429916 RepID=UPI0003DF445D|nr:CoA transferase [Afipia sp. P52-10]ETR78743.1 acetyl-CoA acetyltransferase [Afipia sp. P52-10]
MNRALTGVRVIDLTAVIAGPLGTRTLAEYGADVIKIESPTGDVLRASSPSRSQQMGALYLNLNRNKRSIALDLKSPQAMDVMRKLIAGADVLAHNMRPDALKRAGLDYEACKTINPKLIHAGIIGFGRGGRYRDRPAYDDLIQATSGFASLFSRSGGPPRYVPMNIVDRLTGVTAVHAILAALFHRERTGQGQALEIPMFENLIEFMLGDHMSGHLFDPPAAPMGNVRALSPNRRPYPTKDGAICVLPGVDKHWKSFFEVAGLEPQYGSDPRFATASARAQNIEEALALLAKALETKTTAEWLDLLTKADIPCGPVMALEDLYDDPHLQDVGFFGRYDHPTEGKMTIPRPAVWMSETPPRVGNLAPPLGADTRAVLTECGYSASEIDALLARGVARTAE